MREIILVAMLAWTFVVGLCIQTTGLPLWARILTIVIASVIVIILPAGAAAVLDGRPEQK